MSNIGIRSRIIFDSIDLNILNYLSKRTFGIMELGGKIEIKHNSFKRHLDRLEDLELIIKRPDIKGMKKILSLSKNGEVVLGIFKNGWKNIIKNSKSKEV